MGKRRQGAEPAASWQRFNAYLTPSQMAWMTQVRGRYMMEAGRNLGNTDLIRIALSELERLDWDRLKRVLDKHPGRASR